MIMVWDALYNETRNSRINVALMACSMLQQLHSEIRNCILRNNLMFYGS